MSKKVFSDLDFTSGAKLVNLPDGTNPQDAATVAQVTAGLEGIKPKAPVAVAAQANVTIATPGATIDGYTPTSGNRATGSVLLYNQTDATENGIWIWNGASAAMTRAADADLGSELTNAVVSVINGTDANTTFLQTTVAPTLGSSNIVWQGGFGSGIAAASETVAGKIELATQAEVNTGTDALRAVTPVTLTAWTGNVKRYAASIGNGTDLALTVTHNLNTRDVNVGVYRAASPYDEVLVDVARTTVDTLTVTFVGTAPTSNEYRVVVTG